jgi:hypothetical protein
MEGALRGFADALLRAAEDGCSTGEGRGGARCRDALCRVAAYHDALARADFAGVAAALAPKVEIECFGIHLPGFTRLARGVDAAVELLRSNEAGMRWLAIQFESATTLGETLIVFRQERGRFAAVEHEAFVVSHYRLEDALIARIRARAFATRAPA